MADVVLNAEEVDFRSGFRNLRRKLARSMMRFSSQPFKKPFSATALLTRTKSQSYEKLSSRTVQLTPVKRNFCNPSRPVQSKRALSSVPCFLSAEIDRCC